VELSVSSTYMYCTQDVVGPMSFVTWRQLYIFGPLYIRNRRPRYSLSLFGPQLQSLLWRQDLKMILPVVIPLFSIFCTF